MVLGSSPAIDGAVASLAVCLSDQYSRNHPTMTVAQLLQRKYLSMAANECSNYSVAMEQGTCSVPKNQCTSCCGVPYAVVHIRESIL